METTYNGITFKLGDVAFADAVPQYAPVTTNGNPTSEYRFRDAAIGSPDAPPPAGASNSFVSLGEGGRIVVRFDDNVLVGSGDANPDLYIDEAGTGASAERMFVEISETGSTWISVGVANGGPSSIDIDPFLVGSSADRGFRFVRITDDKDQVAQTSAAQGADIDAVGAITSGARMVGNDTPEMLNGTEGREVIIGGGGADTISAGAERDTLEGGEGDDVIFGGAGVDRIFGENGDDQLFGGRSEDADYIEGGSGRDQIYSNGGEDTVFGGNDDDIIGTGEGDDSASGGSGRDTMFGSTMSGKDTLDGGDDRDVIYAGADADSVDGGNDDDEIGGGSGADSLKGGSGNDTIFGGGGNDTISGGGNSDLLYGGAGDDAVFLGNYANNPSPTFSRDSQSDIYGAVASNGDDTLYGFEVGTDDVNLREVSTLNNFTDVQSNLSSNVQNYAVLDLGNGDSITFFGVTQGSLTANDFIF